MGVLVSRKQQDDLETAIKYGRPAEMRCVDSNSNSSEGPPIHHGLIEIPCEYPHRDIQDEIYFHGAVPALEAKFMLKRERSFLVRRTIVHRVHFLVLTFKWNDRHHDVLIRKADNANVYYIYKHCSLVGSSNGFLSVLFYNIPELIEYHCSMKQPVNRKGATIEYAVRRRDWSLYVQQVQIGQIIGSGEFGLVYNAKVLRLYCPNQKAVLKVLQKSEDMTSDVRSRLMREAHLMMSLRHKNIIQIYGICGDESQLLMALERASGGSLEKCLRENILSSKKKAGFCKDVIKGMAYLSSEGVVHRDLAARNCLVSGSGCIKVSDFGLSFWGSGQLRLREGRVPIRWLSPEVLKDKAYSTKSDTWSLGVVLYEVWTSGNQPYSGMSKQEVKKFVVDRNTLAPPSEMPDFYKQMMAICFEFDVEQRPTPVQIRGALKTRDLLSITPIHTARSPVNGSYLFSFLYLLHESTRFKNTCTYMPSNPSFPS